MLAPERRRRSDLVAAAVILVVAVVALGVVWLRSDAHGTTYSPAASPLPQADTATSVPTSLNEVWRASSPVTRSPAVTGSAVVTGDGGTVRGLDPATGSVAWSYSRDRDLCSVTDAWNTAVAVFSDDRGCSQVTELDGATGNRKAQRTSDADDAVHTSDDGTYLTARGDTRMEVWRSDLVRTLEYGRVDAPVNPNSQPRTGCTLLSSASNSSRVAVLERCPGESAARLTMLAPAPKDAQQPEVYGSSVVAALEGPSGAFDGATVLVASGDRVALAIPTTAGIPARVGIYDGNAQPLSEFELPDAVAGTGPFPDTEPVKAASVFAWWTGTATVALNLGDLSPAWSLPSALGPGAVMAGRLLVPVPDGIAVIDPATGSIDDTVAVDRAGYTGPIGTAVVGDVVLEQRQDTVVALAAGS
ncbi:Rv3212 family protein [Rhodococcoides kyotonense]|uniref:PQQ-like domain-containing protein n=1 Tax=Rhodococcoides kyotonense TaxID=398843 RepID=A0A239LU41_9NOCA|nr:PQQ-binding-like beta-propeller repeat protein [Rhodococcus kyotonensis]SNT33790.1 PQQ-like domain-containing protein [Rhodococcus kyotonensis]